MKNFTDSEMGAANAPQDEHEEISRIDQSIEWPCYRENSIFESTVVELAASLEVSDEMARTSILGAMSIACQGLINVAFPNGHTVPVSLMTLMIAETGERKTATDDFSVKPIKEFVRKMNEELE